MLQLQFITTSRGISAFQNPQIEAARLLVYKVVRTKYRRGENRIFQLGKFVNDHHYI